MQIDDDVLPDLPVLKCPSKTRKGEPCSQPAGFGTDHPGEGPCRYHGGAHPASTAKSVALMVAKAARIGGNPIPITDFAALELAKAYTNGEIAWLDEQIMQLDASGTGPGAGALVAPISVHRRPLNLGTKGEDPSLTVTETRAAPFELHVLIRERQKCVERLAKYAKMSLDAGVDERMARVHELQGMAVAKMIYGIFNDLDITLDPRATAVVQRRLEALDVDTIEGTATEIA